MHSVVTLDPSNAWLQWLYIGISLVLALIFYGIKAHQFEFSRLFRFFIFCLVLCAAYGHCYLLKTGFTGLYVSLGMFPASDTVPRLLAGLLFLLHCCLVPNFTLRKNIKNPIAG